MTYAAIQDYKDEFASPTDDTTIEKLLKRSSEKIDYHTFERIINNGFDNFSDKIKTLITRATIFGAYHLHLKENYNDGNAGVEFSLGDLTIKPSDVTDFKIALESNEPLVKDLGNECYQLITRTKLNNKLLDDFHRVDIAFRVGLDD